MKICYLNGADAGKTVDLSPSGLSIGRETDNSIQLLVGGVSRYHAKIERKNDQWVLQDLGSTNGTKVNGTVISAPVILKDRDMIIIGDQHFRVDRNTSGNAESASVSPAALNEQTVVPSPAPSFVFRPDTAPQPPPPPPLQATMQMETPATGQDIFQKPENVFKKEKPAGKSSLRGNLIFAAVLTLMLVIGLILILDMMKKDQADQMAGQGNHSVSKKGTADNPFFFFWERQIVDAKTKNIFKFKIHGELGYDSAVTKKGKMEKRFFVTTVLDDLENGRHFYKKFGTDDKIPENVIAGLQKSIEKTGFMNEQNSYTLVAGNPNYERLVIGYGGKLQDAVYYDGNGENNMYFNSAMQLIRNFVEEEVCATHGISIVNTAAEIRQRAQEFYTQAQRADENHINDPKDLYRAIKFYERADLLYMQFRQIPKERYVVQDRLAVLRQIYKEKRKEGFDLINQAKTMGNLDEAIRLCEKYMQYYPEGTATYNAIREHKLKIEAVRRKSLKGN